MERHFGSGYDQHLLSSTLNLSGFPFTNGYLNTEPVHRYPYPVEDSTLRNLPPVPGSGFLQSKASEPNRLQNWLYHKQQFHQAFIPAPDSASGQKFPLGLSDVERLRTPTIPGQKRFLVFDQSGDKTTLLYSSGVHAPVQFGACQPPNLPSAYNLGVEMRDLKDESFEENSKDVTEGEMREDTEELDALLCSDYDSDFSEDEETSTGHSPSTMTDNGAPKLAEETGEEVDSFSVPLKRRKLLDGNGDIPSSMYDASSVKTFAYSEQVESDAESSCGSRKEASTCKRSRKDEILDTVSILQSIIPDSNGKDAIFVIDQAIHYLRSLKAKAKALGLESLDAL
ncbi:transcription factor bHLH145-like [Salvia hispanica]|uniref:transcription factor bHLH145-like n=1 Tax=Salvia hispanica TaxID=49212 RepID=UPI00200958D1|nr:transcription factor bHLH145-like [Salvia hispanica]XP_047970795.1 transcription factor bHLH145-like [Salvia hispanica]